MTKYKLRKGWNALYSLCRSCGTIMLCDSEMHLQDVPLAKAAKALRSRDIPAEFLIDRISDIPFAATLLYSVDLFYCPNCGEQFIWYERRRGF